MRALAPFAAAAALACGLLPAGAHAAGASALLYERTLMVEADRRCALFSPAIAHALRTAAAQSRRTAVREAGPAAARAAEARARVKASETACGAPDLRLAAERVRSAHAGWTQIPRMAFPGERASWMADRSVSKLPRWRSVQHLTLDGQPAAFGLYATGRAEPRLLAVARFKRPPAFARLVIGGRPYLAESRQPAPKSLRSDGPGDALAFRFPDAAVTALERLDHGDTVRLDFVTTSWSGERTRSALIEVGDFAAARAFLQASAR
jgi:hypothetical protein